MSHFRCRSHETSGAGQLPDDRITVGDLDIHDVAVDADGKVVFVNTLFGCLATTSERHSFTPLWQPPFLTKLAAEDRCHLNGFAMEPVEQVSNLPSSPSGRLETCPTMMRPAYVTCVSRSDVADGWRDR